MLSSMLEPPPAGASIERLPRAIHVVWSVVPISPLDHSWTLREESRDFVDVNTTLEEPCSRGMDKNVRVKLI